MATAGNQ